jgi:nicotinamide riboside transporter PnuC
VVNPWWSAILTAIGVTGLYLVTCKRREGFALGVVVQVLWIAYAVATRQWPFIISALAYGAVNVVGWRRFAPSPLGRMGRMPHPGVPDWRKARDIP